MCWNSQSSLTFFILGNMINTIILTLSIINHKYNMIAFCLGWYFVITMQLLEYFIWSHKNNESYSFLAYIFNILQILVIYQSFISISNLYNVHWINKLIASIILLYYIFNCFYWTKNNKYNINIKSKHLIYPWWNNKKGLLYLFCLISLFLLLARPIEWSFIILSLILSLFFLSYIYYRPYVASMWCFFVVLLPIIAYFIY